MNEALIENNNQPQETIEIDLNEELVGYAYKNLTTPVKHDGSCWISSVGRMFLEEVLAAMKQENSQENPLVKKFNDLIQNYMTRTDKPAFEQSWKGHSSIKKYIESDVNGSYKFKERFLDDDDNRCKVGFVLGQLALEEYYENSSRLHEYKPFKSKGSKDILSLCKHLGLNDCVTVEYDPRFGGKPRIVNEGNMNENYIENFEDICNSEDKFDSLLNAQHVFVLNSGVDDGRCQPIIGENNRNTFRAKCKYIKDKCAGKVVNVVQYGWRQKIKRFFQIIFSFGREGAKFETYKDKVTPQRPPMGGGGQVLEEQDDKNKSIIPSINKSKSIDERLMSQSNLSNTSVSNNGISNDKIEYDDKSENDF